MPSVYLCGPINGCTDTEASNWREYLKNEGPGWVDWIDPMKRDYRGKEMTNYREIVDLDKVDVRKSDIILVNYVKPSVGTSMEVFYAWALGKPVIVVSKPDSALSPWLIYHSTVIVYSLEEAIEKILIYSN